jgi:hypothetical protein
MHIHEQHVCAYVCPRMGVCAFCLLSRTRTLTLPVPGLSHILLPCQPSHSPCSCSLTRCHSASHPHLRCSGAAQPPSSRKLLAQLFPKLLSHFFLCHSLSLVCAHTSTCDHALWPLLHNAYTLVLRPPAHWCGVEDTHCSQLLIHTPVQTSVRGRRRAREKEEHARAGREPEPLTRYLHRNAGERKALAFQSFFQASDPISCNVKEGER